MLIILQYVYFTVRQNTIHKHAKFNRRQQGETESVDKFIVISIQDAQLSEKIQMKPELTLERMVIQAYIRVSASRHSNQQLEGSCCKKHHKSCKRHKAAKWA